MTQNCMNIPMPSKDTSIKDVAKAFEEMMKERRMPSPWDEHLLKCLATTCVNGDRMPKSSCTKDEVMQVKKLIGQLTIGPLDKNTGRLVACCPVLYKRCMEKTYDLENSTHYAMARIRAFCASKEHQLKNEDLIANMQLQDDTMEAAMEKESFGGVYDLMKRWKLFYTRMGWDKICDFEDKGQLGYMYAIFKDKNIMDLEKRTEKHTNARPITPFCKHPMKRLLNYAAQGWNFLIKQLKGEHFILHKCKDFKAKVKQLNKKWKHVHKKESRSWDISGCYTHIPKGDVLEALERVIDLVRESPALHDVEGVFEGMKSPAIKAKTNKGIINVPKIGKGPAHWGRSSNMDRVNLTFKQLMDIAKFSLENAYFTMGDKIVQQTVGLPMGDPLSPAMCIATCAIMRSDSGPF